MKNNTCTCIIPFYNEQNWVIKVLDKLASIKHFDHIILVNDGSQDNSLNLVQNFVQNNNYTHLQIISYPKNKWKAFAIQQWLKQSKSDYVFLFDSDLKWINKKEIQHVIQNMYQNPQIDMWIMRRIHAKRYIKLLYRELILSWQRMLKTSDLRKVFQRKFEKYQLEVAINTFMQDHQKVVVRYPFSGENTSKSDKRWFRYGRKRDFFMFRDIFKYQWLIWYIRHSFLFSPINSKSYKNSK